MDSSAIQCQICYKTKSKYTCPKCNKPYCSIECYRAPSHQQCSEVFYKDCVTSEIASRSISELSRSDSGVESDIKRMYEILQRLEAGEDVNEEEVDEEGNNLDSDDEEDEIDLAVRLDGINLDDTDAVWQRLNVNEQQEFKTLLQSGEISKILPTFHPWWEIKIPHELIKDLDEKTEPVQLGHPQLLENIALLETLIKKPPSPCLPNNLYNILASYTCAVRFYNGEHHSSPYESAKFLVYNSATLKNNTNFIDTEQAVKSVALESCNIASGQFIAADVEKIIEGSCEGRRDSIYVKAALSDIFRLIGAAKCTLKTIEADRSNSSDTEHFDKKKLNQVLKKIEFFLSFVSSSSQ